MIVRRKVNSLERDISYDTTNAQATLQQEQVTSRTRSLQWRDFITVTKPGIVRSSLLSTVAAFWLAARTVSDTAQAVSGLSGFLLFIYTGIGTTLILAASCVLNNYLDRDLDRLMQRTKKRPSVQSMSPKLILGYGIGLGVAGILIMATLVSIMTAVLGLLGIFFYVIVYTMLMKRTSSLNTVVGGFAGSIPPMMGWCAVTGSLDAAAGILFIVLFLWQPPHFLALAMLRKDEYRAAGFKMLPSEGGIMETKWQMLLWVTAMVPASLLLFLLPPLGYLYLSVMAVLGGVWVVYALQGVFGKVKDEKRWAGKMFGYSLIYLVAMYAVIFIDAAF